MLKWFILNIKIYPIYGDKLFKEWGYLAFEAYCAKEIGIRPATAKKLLHSYYFLEKEEPSLLKQLSDESPRQLPSVEAVNVLRLLKNRQGVPAGDYQKVRSYALEQGREPSEIRREVRSMLESAQPDPEAARAARRQAALKRMIGTLKAMRTELLAANWVPKKLLAEIEALTQKLEALV